MHLYSLDRQTSVRLTVGYHMPCRSAGEMEAWKLEASPLPVNNNSAKWHPAKLL